MDNVITIGNNFDWNTNTDIPEEYLDNPDIERLRKNKLPVIKDVAVLFRSLNLSMANAKKFFYPKYRRTFLYRSYELPKKKGGTRTISVPIPELMLIQKAINSVILSEFKMSSHCKGFKKNVNLVDNARPHLGAKTLLKFDIHDFFGSIKYKHVIKQFKFYGYGNKVAELLTLLCVDGDDKLPQGAPTSPALSNLVSLKMDKRIAEYSKKHSLTYTRYADDITISSKVKLSHTEIDKVKYVIDQIVTDEGFTLNESKTHYFYFGQDMVITGVHINNSILNPPKRMLLDIDNALYYIKKYGLSSHLSTSKGNLLQKYNKDTYLNHLLGLISYIYMINPIKGKFFLDKYNSIPEDKLK